MKKLFICFIAFISLFICRNVYADDILLPGNDDLYVYFTEPVVGERPEKTANIKLVTASDIIYDQVEITWYEYIPGKYPDGELPSVDYFEDGKYYSFFRDLKNDDIYDNAKLIYYNDVLVEDRTSFNHDVVKSNIYKPLPARILDNSSSGLVKITDLSLDSKSTTTTISETPSFKDLKVSLGFNFINKDDYAKYKVTVKNDDKVDYTLKSNSMFSESGYIKYDLDFIDGSDIIKSNTEKTFYITARYEKEVPDEMLVDGVYTESNKAKLVFVNDTGIVNPNTSNKIIFIFGLLLVIVIGSLFVKFKEVKVILLIVTGILILIPISSKALNEISIDVDANIKVQKVLEFCSIEKRLYCGDFHGFGNIKKYSYLPGTTINDVIYNTYKNTNSSNVYLTQARHGNSFSINKYTFTADYNVLNIENISFLEVDGNDLIKESSEGCYIVEVEETLDNPDVCLS